MQLTVSKENLQVGIQYTLYTQYIYIKNNNVKFIRCIGTPNNNYKNNNNVETLHF